MAAEDALVIDKAAQHANKGRKFPRPPWHSVYDHGEKVEYGCGNGFGMGQILHCRWRLRCQFIVYIMR